MGCVRARPAEGDEVMRIRASVAVAALIGALAACGSANGNTSAQPSTVASSSPSPTVTVLDEDAAGVRYMTIVCGVNAEADGFDEFSMDVPYGAVMTAEYRQRMRKLGATWRRAGRQLVAPDHAWPASVAPSVERVAEQFYGYASAIADAAKEESVEPINWDDSRKATNRIRLRLGLPPAGTGCKKYLGLGR